MVIGGNVVATTLIGRNIYCHTLIGGKFPPITDWWKHPSKARGTSWPMTNENCLIPPSFLVQLVRDCENEFSLLFMH